MNWNDSFPQWNSYQAMVYNHTLTRSGSTVIMLKSPCEFPGLTLCKETQLPAAPSLGFLTPTITRTLLITIWDAQKCIKPYCSGLILLLSTMLTAQRLKLEYCFNKRKYKQIKRERNPKMQTGGWRSIYLEVLQKNIFWNVSQCFVKVHCDISKGV